MRRKRTWTIIAFIAAVVVLTASALIPVENAFLSFASPEAAYRYNHSGAVMLEINGEKTTFLVGEKGDTYEYAIIPKAKDGWKLGVGSDVDRVVQTVSNGITVQVYQYKKQANTTLWCKTQTGVRRAYRIHRILSFCTWRKQTACLIKSFLLTMRL